MDDVIPKYRSRMFSSPVRSMAYSVFSSALSAVNRDDSCVSVFRRSSSPAVCGKRHANSFMLWRYSRI
eukprot:313640-Rhodomonas_salina.1